jgi:hypothetical protein
MLRSSPIVPADWFVILKVVEFENDTSGTVANAVFEVVLARQICKSFPTLREFTNLRCVGEVQRADALLRELVREVAGPSLIKGEAHIDVGHQCTFSIAFGILRKTRL